MLDEVVNICFVCVLHAKIIDNEGEGDWLGLVAEQVGRVWDRVLSFLFEMRQ